MKGVLAAAHLVGGNAQVASDGMTANPTSIRGAGFEVAFSNPPGIDVITLARNSMRPFQPTVRDGAYRPDTEYNHVSNDLTGPLKNDTSKPCPRTFTEQEQQQHCVSLPETVWGAARLARLVTIKRAVDPHHRFACFRCIGSEWAAAPVASAP